MICAELDIDYPWTARPANAADDERLARSVQGSAIVKPVQAAIARPDGLTFLPGATLVGDGPSAARALAELRRRGVQPLLQEHLRGEKLQAMIIRRAGATSFRFAFRVAREHPPHGGSGSMLEALAHGRGVGARLVAVLERLVDAAGYEGFVGAEFVRSGNRLCVIDVNPRLGGALAFAELLGLRVAERAVRDATGAEPLPPAPDPAGRRYHHLLRELAWLRGRPGAAPSVLRSVSRRDAWDVPSPTDPLPDLLRLAWVLRSSVPRTARIGGRR